LLDVNGVVRIEESSKSGCFKYNSSTVQLQYSNDCSTYNNFSAAAAGGWTDDGSVVRLTTGSDIVGVGSTTPFASFAINPTAGTASNQFVIGSSTATNFVVTNSGNVAIGTSSPTWGASSFGIAPD